MRGWLRRKIVYPVLALLRQGMTPEKLALSITLGLALGVVPVLGSTSLLCFLAALLLGLNQPAIQLVNFVAYPLQLAMLVPFLRLGERLFGAPPMGLTPAQMVAMIRADMGHAIITLWSATMHALVVWLGVGMVVVPLLYPLLSAVLRQASRRMREETLREA